MNNSFPTPLLVIEASLSAGSVALVVDDVIVAERDVQMGRSREDTLMPAIADAMQHSGISVRDVRALACGGGPGSFTSLRIAAALAKGFAVANNAPLYAIPSLSLAAMNVASTPGSYVLHSDALRGERYVIRVDVSDNRAISVSPVLRMLLVDVQTMSADTGAQLVCVGSAPSSERDALVILPRARDVLRYAQLVAEVAPVSVEAWEPDYGRLAEAQVKWEATHGRVLPVG